MIIWDDLSGAMKIVVVRIEMFFTGESQLDLGPTQIASASGGFKIFKILGVRVRRFFFNPMTPTYIWVVVSNIVYLHPNLGKIPILTHMFLMR